MDAAGRSPSPLPQVSATSGNSPDLVRLLHQRRTQLVERETALQRWVVALELEAARQASVAKQLKQQEEKVQQLAAEASGNREEAQALLADVAQREQALQREAAEVQQQLAAAAAERQELAAQHAALEAAANEVSARASELGRREQSVAAAEEQWEAKVAQADRQLKVRCAAAWRGGWRARGGVAHGHSSVAWQKLQCCCHCCCCRCWDVHFS